jgi:DEAD/DEAH box helicase
MARCIYLSLRSGKTCGFLLPAFHRFMQEGSTPAGASHAHNGRGPGGPTPPKLLVLAPTRELSVQIMEEAQKFGRPLGIRSLCCYGGSSKYPQIASLQRGVVECLIATPGRLNDLLEMGKANLGGIQFLVLDEADRVRFYCCHCCAVDDGMRMSLKKLKVVIGEANLIHCFFFFPRLSDVGYGV